MSTMWFGFVIITLSFVTVISVYVTSEGGEVFTPANDEISIKRPTTIGMLPAIGYLSIDIPSVP